MNSRKILRWLLVVWVVWHLAFGLLSTFAPETGARLVGWTAEGGWDAALITMSSQYGMVMLLLAGMYLVMAIDPVRYLGLLSVAVAEQILGVAYAIYIYDAFGQLTLTELLLQGTINGFFVLVFVALWSSLRGEAPAGAD